jgi:AraC family transcriptional regulator
MAGISELVVYFHMGSIDFPLDTPPVIVQAGLSLHGYRRREVFRMHGLWGVHLYLYAGTLRIGDARHPFSNGQLSITPPDTDLEWVFPDHAPHYYAHIRVTTTPAPRRIPVLMSTTRWLEEAIRGFEYIGSLYREEPRAASARLWALLWRAVTDSAPSPHLAGRGTGLPATVQIAVSIVDQALSERMRVAHLAQRVGVSHNHLLSLFRQSFGTTVAEYIRNRRCERARFLLENTSLSVKSIAREVGIPDLHHFNKTMRNAYGISPRALRTQLVQNHKPDSAQPDTS